jgi:hypothetical protein
MNGMCPLQDRIALAAGPLAGCPAKSRPLYTQRC